MSAQRDFAARLLQTVAEELEAVYRQHRYCNTMLARFAGDATQLLKLEHLTPRFVYLLKRSRWKGFFGGIMTNARLPWFVPSRLRRLSPIEKVNTDYPVFTSEYAVHVFKRYYPEMLPCIEQGFDQLLNEAKSELALEEVALSQAILAKYKDALETADKLREIYRKNNVRFVIAIEHFRHDRVGEAEMLLATLKDGTLNGWGAAHFAVGICNHVPWSIYPYPDY